jgi:hypothetical protein
MAWPDEWPAGSAYPDYFAIGDVYTNAYEGSASLTDIRLYGLASDTPTTSTPLPIGETVTSEPSMVSDGGEMDSNTTESTVSSGEGDPTVPDEGGEMESSTTESPMSSGGEEGTNPPDEIESLSLQAEDIVFILDSWLDV